MALIIANRVKETTTTTGTGALTLVGAMTGFSTFASRCTTNDTCYYALQAVDGSGVPTGAWECGLGTYSGTNTLTRTTVIQSSNSDAVVSLAAGTTHVWIDIEASWFASHFSNFTGALNTASPNATVTVVSYAARGAATDIDIAFGPKGSGAVTAHIADSTATGGNKRGTNAVDWQTNRTGAANVASGTSSTVGGGRDNKASAADTTVAGGAGNYATANGAKVGGGFNNGASGQYATVAGGYSGTGSGDYSAIAGGSANTASNSYATVAGGTANNVSVSYGAIGGGANNTVNSQFGTIPGGYAATTRGVIGLMAYASGFIDTGGDAQMGRYVMRGKTTDATAKTLTTDNAGAGTNNQVVLPNNATYDFNGRLSARNTSNGDSASFVFSGVIRRGANAAATALVATVTPAFGQNDTGAATWACAVTADTTNGGLKIAVTGVAATTIKWVCAVETVETTN